jgi:hypothetical protein
MARDLKIHPDTIAEWRGADLNAGSSYFRGVGCPIPSRESASADGARRFNCLPVLRAELQRRSCFYTASHLIIFRPGARKVALKSWPPMVEWRAP